MSEERDEETCDVSEELKELFEKEDREEEEKKRNPPKKAKPGNEEPETDAGEDV